MKHHPGGSHSNHAHPDGQMSPRHAKIPRHLGPWNRAIKWARYPTSTQRQAGQKIANAKRRRRDRSESWG